MENTPITLNSIKVWIPILGLVATGGIAYAMITSTNQTQDTKITSIETRMTDYEKNQNLILQNIVKLQTVIEERLPAKK